MSTCESEVKDRQFTFASVNDGREPEASVTVNEFSGRESKIPRGSLRSLRISSSVLMIVVVISRFSNPSTLALGVEILRVRLGVVETARATREAQNREKSIATKLVKAGGSTETLAFERARLKYRPGPRG